MIYDISHRSHFGYTQPVSISHHVLRLAPRQHPRQTCSRSAIIVDPAPSLRTEAVDYFGNRVTHLTVQQPHTHLRVHASSRVEVMPADPLDLDVSAPWEEVAAAIATAATADSLDASQYSFNTTYVHTDDQTLAYALESYPAGRSVLVGARDLTSRIFREFEYKGGVTDVSTPVSEVLANRKGVCQDFAHLAIACLRSLGLAARYVSGYLLTVPPEGQQKLVGSDASHAWLSVWCPVLGWVDFDPTNDLIPEDEHITLAWGRDYGDVSPINGIIVGGGAHDVKVSVDVSPV